MIRYWQAVAWLLAVGVIAYVVIQTEKQDNDLQEQADLIAREVQENRETLCGAARIVSFNPVAQLPGETRHRFLKRQEAYRIFLELAEGIDCDTVLQVGKKPRGVDADSGTQPPPGRPGPPPRGPSAPPQMPQEPAEAPKPPEQVFPPTDPTPGLICDLTASLGLPICPGL